MREVTRNQMFGLVAALSGTLVLIKSVSGLLFFLGEVDFSFSWAFLVVAVGALILLAGGIVMVLGTVTRKPLFLVTNESMRGRIFIGIFGVTSFVIGVMLLLIALFAMAGGGSSELNLPFPGRAIPVAVAGLVLTAGGLVMMPKTMERKPFSLLKG